MRWLITLHCRPAWVDHKAEANQLVAEQSKEAILASYGLSEADRVGGGMEAAVYRHGADVIKLYLASDQLLRNLHELQTFYAALGPAVLPYALPAIKQIVRKGGYIVTHEPFLAGEPFTARIAATAPADLEQLFLAYEAAVYALSQIEMPPAATRHQDRAPPPPPPPQALRPGAAQFASRGRLAPFSQPLACCTTQGPCSLF
mgnify:CR=1 FL=1